MYACATTQLAVGTAGDLTAELEPLMEEGRVDLVIGGHVHGYERTHATGRNGATVVLPTQCKPEQGLQVDCYASPGAPVHINVGMGGAGSLGHFKGKPELTELRSSKWNAVSEEDGYGYVRVTVSSQYLLIEYVDIGERRWDRWSQHTPQPERMSVMDHILLAKYGGG